jgi:hypothetical protein
LRLTANFSGRQYGRAVYLYIVCKGSECFRKLVLSGGVPAGLAMHGGVVGTYGNGRRCFNNRGVLRDTANDGGIGE